MPHFNISLRTNLDRCQISTERKKFSRRHKNKSTYTDNQSLQYHKSKNLIM